MAITAAKSTLEWVQDNVRGDDNERVNILIVDDLPENQLVYRSILEDLGQNLMAASSGEEALKLVLKAEFAVIMLDVNMPGMDGFEIAALIRSRKRSARTPIIFLTAFTDEMRMAQGYASGAVDYLPTPVVPEILKAKIKVFIELSQMRRQAALQAEERARRQAAEEADQRKDEFLGMLAHELRNPLGPLLNAAHLLRRIAPQELRIHELSDIIERQVKHMSRLLDDLLDATRLAHGKILLKKKYCDFTDIVRQTAEDYRSLFESDGLTLNIKPTKPVWLEGDPVRLAQIVGNVLHNARKFTERGGSITVELDYDKRRQMAILRITDTGIGIEAAMLPHVFDVFCQAEQGLDHSRGGLGLGLALVKGLVELHGGHVSAGSDGPGKGAKFTIELPAESTSPEKTGSQEDDTHPSNTPSYRILIIEDNRLTAESMQTLLHFDGHDVQIAINGPAGLEATRAFHPQIILCDVGLPGMDGYQLVRTLRQDKDIPSPYIIAMTGYGREDDQRQAHEAGFDLHMTKPVDYDHLRRTLAQLPAKK